VALLVNRLLTIPDKVSLYTDEERWGFLFINPNWALADDLDLINVINVVESSTTAYIFFGEFVNSVDYI
jgi:hypothetical protein